MRTRKQRAAYRRRQRDMHRLTESDHAKTRRLERKWRRKSAQLLRMVENLEAEHARTPREPKPKHGEKPKRYKWAVEKRTRTNSGVYKEWLFGHGCVYYTPTAANLYNSRREARAEVKAHRERKRKNVTYHAVKMATVDS